MAHEAGFLTEPFLQLHQKNIGIAQYEHNDYGWWTDNAHKVKSAYRARQYFALGTLCYMKNLVCANPFEKEGDRRKTVKAKFEEQIKRYRPVEAETTNPHSVARVTISGTLISLIIRL
jgi:hypothetical protein